MRQSKSFNNFVKLDHRAIKRVTRMMLGFTSLLYARILIAGIETMHMIRKSQLRGVIGQATYAADQFYSLTF